MKTPQSVDLSALETRHINLFRWIKTQKGASMDFWNRKRVKDLEIRLNIAESKNRGLQKQIEKLEAKLSGNRVCDGYCENCKHGIQYYVGGICIGPPIYKCALDCKCKDFDRK